MLYTQVQLPFLSTFAGIYCKKAVTLKIQIGWELRRRVKFSLINMHSDVILSCIIPDDGLGIKAETLDCLMT